MARVSVLLAVFSAVWSVQSAVLPQFDHPHGLKCSTEPQPIEPFQANPGFLGRWYQIAVNDGFNQLFENGDEICVFANYSATNNASYLNVVNTGYDPVTLQQHAAVGSIYEPDLNVGQLYVSFGGPYGPYTIIKMLTDSNGDYETFVVWSCSEVMGTVKYLEYIFILSRSQTISDDTYNSLLSYCDSVGIPIYQMNMTRTYQGSDCPY